MKEKGYEKPQILETISIEEVLMDEEVAPEWVNWRQDIWNNSWNNTMVVPKEAETKEKERRNEREGI